MKILVRERIADAGIDFLRRRFEVDVDFDSPLAEKIADYDAIIVRSATDVSAELIDRAERLKVIGRAGVGVDNVDVEAASRRGIVVANAPQSTIVSAAEHAFGLLLALSRNIPQAHAALKEGRWERARFAGLELADKTLGVIGFGRIGQQARAGPAPSKWTSWPTTPTWPQSGSGISARRWSRASRSSCPSRTS